MFKDYEHHAQYYETDQMGCVHHSNYIRWMEEARVSLMEQMGCGYKAMEASGVMSPRYGIVPKFHLIYESILHEEYKLKGADGCLRKLTAEEYGLWKASWFRWRQMCLTAFLGFPYQDSWLRR